MHRGESAAWLLWRPHDAANVHVLVDLSNWLCCSLMPIAAAADGFQHQVKATGSDSQAVRSSTNRSSNY